MPVKRHSGPSICLMVFYPFQGSKPTEISEALPSRTFFKYRKNEYMNLKSNPSSVTAAGLAGRKFSKARSIAETLGVCTRTIFRWADKGKISRHKINARVVL